MEAKNRGVPPFLTLEACKHKLEPPNEPMAFSSWPRYLCLIRTDWESEIIGSCLYNKVWCEMPERGCPATRRNVKKLLKGIKSNDIAPLRLLCIEARAWPDVFFGTGTTRSTGTAHEMWPGVDWIQPVFSVSDEFQPTGLCSLIQPRCQISLWTSNNMQLLQKVTCPNIIKHPHTSCHTSCHTHTLCIIVYRSAHVAAHHPERTSVGIWMSSGAQKPPGHIDMTRPTRLGKDRCENHWSRSLKVRSVN